MGRQRAWGADSEASRATSPVPPCIDMPRDADLAAEIEKAEAELAELGRAREETLARLATLRASGPTAEARAQLRLPLAGKSTAARTGIEKVRLFRTLFRGRVDVFPKRWENAKQERSGY